MPPKSHAPDTEVMVDRTTNTIVLTRTFTAPRELVFEAWTQPEHVACWWDASGARLSLCEIDLRPDGAFRFVHRGRPDVPPCGREVLLGARVAMIPTVASIRAGVGRLDGVSDKTRRRVE